jgi:hypothetical protein
MQTSDAQHRVKEFGKVCGDVDTGVIRLLNKQTKAPVDDELFDFAMYLESERKPGMCPPETSRRDNEVVWERK